MKVYDLVIALAELKSEHGNKTEARICLDDGSTYPISLVEYDPDSNAIVIHKLFTS